MKREFSYRRGVELVAGLVLIGTFLLPLRLADAQASISHSFIYGRIVGDDDLGLPLSTSITLRCGPQLLQAIHPDSAGNFQFNLEAGAVSNMDMSAANGTPVSQEAGHMRSRDGEKSAGIEILGCELDVSAPGYRPLYKPVMLQDSAEIEGIDAGSLILTPIRPSQTGMISVTSLLVPKNARKEFEKGDQDAHSNHLVSAIEHLKKAVAEYDKYALAWNELGRVYSASHQSQEACEAFEKATTADPKYIPPYLGLALLELKDGEYQDAFETAGEALTLDSNIAVASFIQATASYRLNRFDEAEKSARDAERRPHQSIPQLHVLLAEICLQKDDDSSAAAEIRAYLRESPQGEFVGEMKKKLDEIEKSQPSANSGSTLSAQTAP